MRSRQSLPLAIVLTFTLFMYFWNLSDAPMKVGGDEAFFAANARSIVSTGRDFNGRFLPLFFKIDSQTWYQPVLVYAMAPFVALFGTSEWSIRVPTALIGTLDILLVYSVGRKLFESTWLAALGALLLATTPPHMITARQALDYICIVPFVIAWVWASFSAIDEDSAWKACLSGMLLGVGFYSYIAAWVMMPIYLVTTVLFFTVYRGRPRLSIASVLGFLLPFLLFIVWVDIQPDMLGTIFRRYQLVNADQMPLFYGAGGLLHRFVIYERLSLYWNYFDPVYLFLAGSPDPSLSTGKAGIFLIGSGIFLVAGIYDVLQRRDRSLLLLWGLASAPLAPVLIDTGKAIQRELVLLPFAALLGVYGAKRFLEHHRPVFRVMGRCLVAVIVLQFSYVAHDYFTDQRFRAADRIDPVNFEDASDFLIRADASQPVPRIYLSESLDDGQARWLFYLAKWQRLDLWQKTWMVDARARTHGSVVPSGNIDVITDDNVPEGSLFLFYPSDPGVNHLVNETSCCTIVHLVPSVQNDTASIVMRKP